MFSSHLNTAVAEYFAEAVAKKRPPIFNLIKKDPMRPLTFWALGCQGNGSQAQKKVAIEMDKLIAAHPSDAPDFILLLGDNVYSAGMKSADDTQLKSCFTDIYLGLPHLKTIPFFVILGNHDLNFHKMSLPKTEKGIARGMHEVAATYLAPEKREFFSTEKENIQLADTALLGWNLLAPAYALNTDDAILLFLDSNTYVNDFLQLRIQGKPVLENNQAMWFEEEVFNANAQAKPKKVIVALHHPPLPAGKVRHDTGLYIENHKEALEKVLGISNINTVSHNMLVRKCLEMQIQRIQQNLLEVTKLRASFSPMDIQPSASVANTKIIDLFLCAHDHAGYYCSDSTFTELVLGMGGGGLQNRHDFVTDLGFFLKRHGFARITCESNSVNFAVHALKTEKAAAYELHFSNQSLKPLRKIPDNYSEQESESIEKFCNAIKAGLDNYLRAFLGGKQTKHRDSAKFFRLNFSHGIKGVDRANDLWAYLSQKNADDFKTTLKTVYKKIKWDGKTTNPTEHSLLSFIDVEVKKAFSKGLIQLYADHWFESDQKKHSKKEAQQQNLNRLWFHPKKDADKEDTDKDNRSSRYLQDAVTSLRTTHPFV